MERQRRPPARVADRRRRASARAPWLCRATPSPRSVEAIERRVVPGLETLLTAARQREGLEAQVIETRALRRSNVVKTALLRSVSHDLRSPLTAITAAAGGLGSETLDAQARAELISVIATESDRLTRLVDNLLDLSRLQAGQLEPRADWSSSGGADRGGAGDGRGPAGRVRGAARPRPADVRGRRGPDRARAGQRARERRPPRRFRAGDDHRRARRRRALDPGLRPRSRDPAGGAGADLRALPHRGRSRASGTGLGLAIARGFVEANGGSLAGPSRCPARARRFALSLPLERGPGGAMSERQRILICDDEPQILRALRVILGDAGFEVVAGDDRARGARRGRGPAAGRGDRRSRAARRRRGRGLPLDPRVEQDADPRPLGGRRRAREGARARRRRRRLRHQAVRPRRAGRPAARGAAALRAPPGTSSRC